MESLFYLTFKFNSIFTLQAIPATKQRYNVKVTSIDLQNHIVTTQDGKRKLLHYFIKWSPFFSQYFTWIQESSTI